MTKVKYDVTESDPEAASQLSGTFESPRPGVYTGEILEANVKGSGGDPNKPMLEVIFQLTAADKPDNQRFVEQRARLWGYYLLPGHPSYDGFPLQKTDQFLLATGVATGKKRRGTFDTEDLVGVEVGMVVRGGKNLDGDYRGEIASVFASENGQGFASQADEDEDLAGLDEAADEEPETETDDDEVAPYEEWDLSELRAECEARELSPRGSKATLVARLEQNDEEEEGSEEEEEEPDDDSDDPFA